MTADTDLTPARAAVGVRRDGGRRASGLPRRALVIALVVLGLGLVAAPAVFQMFTRAPQGATMLADFEPFMTESRLDGFSADIESIDAAVSELDAAGAEPLSPGYASFSAQWPAIHEDMAGLMDQVSANRTNYEAVAALPSFSLFPWFFVVPGVLVAGIAVAGLLRGRWTRTARTTVALIGVGLAIAPVAFGMFTRAPKGAEMMKAFEVIETTENVQQIQGYFSVMAVGQGAIRLEVVPALEASGLSAGEVAAKYPATTVLNENWVHLLNDMTPMIGAMSDNVGHYQAINALPPFGLFPWFFLIPGVLLVGLALAAGRPGTLTRPAIPDRGDS